MELPPIRSFMDDLTLLNPSTEIIDEMLERLDQLMSWARIKFKPKKSRSLVLSNGKVVTDHHFKLSGDEIPTVSEQPVKSLGRLYINDLKDTSRVKELHEDLEEWLKRIDKCGLPNRFKLWCLKFGLMPRIMWRLKIYEVAISRVEAMEMKISTQIRRWLGVPRSLTNIAFYGHTTNLRLPLRPRKVKCMF